jgi:hypothetical protein
VHDIAELVLMAVEKAPARRAEMAP